MPLRTPADWEHTTWSQLKEQHDKTTKWVNRLFVVGVGLTIAFLSAIIFAVVMLTLHFT